MIIIKDVLLLTMVIILILVTGLITALIMSVIGAWGVYFLIKIFALLHFNPFVLFPPL
jgi:hypothetical protein